MFNKYILKCIFVSQTNVDELYTNAFKSEENRKHSNNSYTLFNISTIYFINISEGQKGQIYRTPIKLYCPDFIFIVLT